MGKNTSGVLRHVVKRRVHLERSQPKSRKKLGLLEKHKDYVLRAKSFHKKEKELQRLQRQAFFKNPDEFAFKMISHEQEEGQMKKKTKPKNKEEAKLLDSQDTRYVRMREQIDKNSIERRAANLHFLDAERSNKHIVFFDDDELELPAGAQASLGSSVRPGSVRRGLQDVDLADYFDTHPDLLSRKANRPRMQQLEKEFFPSEASHKQSIGAYSQLLQRQERVKKLVNVRERLEFRQQMRQKGRRKKVAEGNGDNPKVFKWFAERKR